MKITEIIIRKAFSDENNTLKAIVSIVIDGVLAVHDIKVALLKMHIFFLEIKKLRDTHAAVDQHKNCLVIPVVFVFPQ